MQLTDYLDKGASLGGDSLCLTTNGESLTYAEAQRMSWRIAGALQGSGIGRGDRVAVLSANDPLALTCVFGISRAGAVWCPINPRNEAAENRQLLDLFGCRLLFFQEKFAPLVHRIRGELPNLTTWVCLDGAVEGATTFTEWLERSHREPDEVSPADDELCVLAGTGGTTGKPKGVRLTGHNLETATALTLMSYPFGDRPRYLAFAPLTHSAGVLTFPIMTLGGETVIMPKPDLGEFLRLVERHRITHAFLPPTVIYGLLDHPDLDSTNLESLRCLWYGAAPMSATRLEEALTRIGPVLGQLFGHRGTQHDLDPRARRPLPRGRNHCRGTAFVRGAADAAHPGSGDGRGGHPASPGERGEIVVRGPLVMAGYHENPEATAEVGKHGWHHTSDIGYLDEQNYLYIVDRAKDVIITGGFNVYSAEVEQALLAHPAAQDSAVIGLPDAKWGERVAAVVQLRPAQRAGEDELIAFVKDRLGSVKAPKQIEIWPDLPRSKIGKVLKPEVRAKLAGG
ncbi:AMP-binding protein [Saccharopolyspora shandongensis]|uniref:AMP-binding protein n=1 Tax=Saccharopolyspora shandongensis TaxID=418495 RepID=UPI0034204523